MVVVIAILAAITIVAYNGINSRAKEAASASTAEQAAKKVMAYAVINADTYPSALSDTGLADSGSTSYQYRVDNTANPRTFCLTATTNNISYYVTSSALSPTAGVCAGHAPPGGVVVTNRFMNPRFEGAALPTSQTGATATITTFNGSLMAQGTTTTASGASIRLQPLTQRWTISAGQAVYVAATICNGTASSRAFTINARFYDQPGTSSTLGTELSISHSNAAVLAPGACTTTSVTSTAPPNTQSVGVNANRGTTTSPASGDVFYVDNVFLSDQVSAYADGATSGWIWDGSPNASISTGPAL